MDGIRVTTLPNLAAETDEYDHSRFCHRGGTFWWCSSRDRTVRSACGQSYSYPRDAYSVYVYPLGQGRVLYGREQGNSAVIGDLVNKQKPLALGSVVSGYLEVSEDGTKAAYTQKGYGPPDQRKIIDTRDGRVLSHFAPGIRTRFSSEGRWVSDWGWVSSGNHGMGGVMHIADLQQGGLARLSTPEPETPETVFLSGDRVAVHTGSMVRFFHCSSGDLLHELRLPKGEYLWGSFGSQLITETSSRIRIHSPQDKSRLGDFLHGEVRALSKSGLVATHGMVDQRPEFRIYSMPEGRLLYRHLTGELPDMKSRICWSPDGTEVGLLTRCGQIRRWRVEPGPRIEKVPLSRDGSVTAVLGRQAPKLAATAVGLGSFLFRVGKAAVSRLRGDKTWLEPPQKPYPRLEDYPNVARSPAESLRWLRARLQHLKATVPKPVPEYSSQAGSGQAADLIELRNMQAAWGVVESAPPPYPWDFATRRDLQIAVQNFLRRNHNNTETLLQLFPFLELASRGDFDFRSTVFYSTAGFLKPFRNYLDDIPSPYLAAWKETQARLATINPEEEIESWILPHLDHNIELSDGQRSWFRERFLQAEIGSLLAHQPTDFSRPSEQARMMSNLLVNTLADPDVDLDAALRRRLEDAYSIDLELPVCKRCQEPQRPAAMKTGSICWGCWDG